MGDEVLFSAGAQQKDRSGYERSDLELIVFHCGDPDLILDTAFRQCIDTHFSPAFFNNFEMVSKAENTTLTDEIELKRNSLPDPSNHASAKL